MKATTLLEGDRVHSDTNERWTGTVLKLGLGPHRDQIKVKLDPQSFYPPQMNLTVGGNERNWVRIEQDTTAAG